MPAGKRIIISRTDSIGDVVLSLPVAGALKQAMPDSHLMFLAKPYTHAVIQSCEYVDDVLDWHYIRGLSDSGRLEYVRSLKADAIIHVFPDAGIAKLARKADIPLRIGTYGRLYHWYTCNKLPRVSRRRSDFHEAQLNLMLLKSMGITDIPSLNDIPVLYGFKPSFSLPEHFGRLLSPDVFNLIIHPLSKGSAREWGLDNYASLIGLLPEGSFRIFLTGTEEEGRAFRPALSGLSSQYTDLSGKMSLEELIAFISKADALLAASTGPLHIAAAAGIHALGIYPPIRPMHPGRWAPLGEKTKVFVKDVECEKCRKTGDCECMRSVKAEEIASCLKTLREEKNV